MKKILIGLFLVIVVTAIIYLCFAFVTLTFNFHEWHVLTRGTYVFVCLLCWLGCGAIAEDVN